MAASDGAMIIEYSVLAAFLGVAIIGGTTLFGDNMNHVFGDIMSGALEDRMNGARG
ncbi:MAG: Flp family type IVb pilin [Rhodospirillales bacterium]|nr:Flp family type IVb pilin [Rhodospirillales bacterium]